MNKIVHIRRELLTQEQAGLWITRLDRGLSPSEQVELQAWLAADTAHRTALLEMAALWDRTDELGEQLARLSPLVKMPTEGSTWRMRPVPAALAALTIACAGYWFGFGQDSTSRYQAAPASTHDPQPLREVEIYRTAIGEQRTVKLPDQSVVTLNTATLLHVHYSNSDRTLELIQGEAHFEVAKDDRVFTVRAGETEFKAVGTAFNIRINTPSRTELTVTEGRVRVFVPPAAGSDRSAEQGGVLPPAEATQLVVDAGMEVVIGSTVQVVERLQPKKLEVTLAWKQGMIAFDGQPLEQAVLEVSRYSDVHFVIADAAIKQIPVSGYFKVGDVDGLLAALRTSFDIDAVRVDESIVLSARGQ